MFDFREVIALNARQVVDAEENKELFEFCTDGLSEQNVDECIVVI